MSLLLESLSTAYTNKTELTLHNNEYMSRNSENMTIKDSINIFVTLKGPTNDNRNRWKNPSNYITASKWNIITISSIKYIPENINPIDNNCKLYHIVKSQ